MIRPAALVLASSIVLAVAAGSATDAQERKPGPEPVKAVDWKDLVPAGFNPDRLLEKYYEDVAPMKDNDPRAARLAEQLRRSWENAPVVEALNNKTVKLSGFLVVLEGDGKAVTEFLLVPFFGACIHEPPPPSNQIVLIRTGTKPFKVKQMFQMVAVTGRLRTEANRNSLASASYIIDAVHVEPVGR
jgi:uncharacterized protein